MRTVIACIVFFGSLVAAEENWLVTTSDFKQRPATLLSIDSEGVKLADNQSVPLESFLQLDRTTAAKALPARFTLHLASGDRISGQPSAYANEKLTWSSPAVGEMIIPLKQVRSLARSGKAFDPPASEQPEDLALLGNGDSVRGIVTDISSTKIVIDQNNTPVELPIDAIAVLHLASAGQSKASVARAFRVRLADDSAFSAPSVQKVGTYLVLSLSDKSTHKIPFDSVVTIEQINGPVSWLSSRAPAAVVQTPYFGNLLWPTRFDQTVSGKPITFGGKTYSRGIGVHAYSRLEYPLDGTYEAFRTQYAIAQDEKRQFADVTVRIKLDDRTVHEEKNVKADRLSQVITIDLPREIKRLTLEVDYGEASDTQDRFNWIEPALLKNKPA